MEALLIGTDPEFICYNKKGEVISAINLLPENDKNNKFIIGKRGATCFYDNVQLEVNVNPAQSSVQLVENLRDAFYSISKLIEPNKFYPQASFVFPEKQLQHRDARVFGCEPEFDAYLLEVVKPPVSTDGFRSAGGHIHLGQKDGSYPLTIPVQDEDSTERDWARIAVIRMMDLFVGLPGVILDKDPTSQARRKLYGKAGSHRTKPYGVEYRSMGNFWLSDPKYVHLIYKLSYQAVKTVHEGGYSVLWKNNLDETKCKYPIEKVRQAINDSDVMLAKKLVEKYVKPLLPEEIYLEFISMTDVNPVEFFTAWGIGK